MTFRSRLVLAGIIVSWVPVLCLGLLIRSAGTRRLADANEQRMRERGDRLAEAWLQGADRLDDRLTALGALLTEDNTVRIAARARRGPGLQAGVARFASSSGLDVAFVTDGAGEILAASHFPGDAGRRDPALVAPPTGGGPVVTRVSFPASDGIVLARAPVRMSGRGRSSIGGRGGRAGLARPGTRCR